MSGPIELRDAATVMLVRDDRAGELEVFMLRRSLDSDFVGGAYVFPGGAVDPDDRATDLEPVCEGLTDAEASARLGVLNGDGDHAPRGPAHDLYGPMGSGGLAFWVAAIRECFEEAGVLLAHDAGGELVRLGDPDVAARFAEHRRAVDSGERRLVEICIEEGLRLAVGGIHYFSHWITPVGPPRRYDTRFFLARAPEDQEPLHDDRETIANCWIRPGEALERHRRGEFDLILPTIKNLEALGRFATADEVLAAAAAVDEVPTVLPRIVEAAGGIRILLPGDPGYDDASPELPAGVPMPGRPGGPTLPT